MAQEERAICDLLDDFTRALYAKDPASTIAPLADDAVTFDLAPPLQLGPELTHDPVRLENWFATWKGPIVSKPGERTIVVDDNVAYAYGLQRMTGTKSNGEEVELWFRATACFRRENGEWRITHMHNSVPFAMDGSDRALLDLKPCAVKHHWNNTGVTLESPLHRRCVAPDTKSQATAKIITPRKRL